MPITCFPLLSSVHSVYTNTTCIVFSYTMYPLYSTLNSTWKCIPKLKQNNGLGASTHITDLHLSAYCMVKHSQRCCCSVNRHLSPCVSLPFIFSCLTFVSIQVEVSSNLIFKRQARPSIYQAYIVNNIIHSTIMFRSWSPTHTTSSNAQMTPPKIWTHFSISTSTFSIRNLLCQHKFVYSPVWVRS